MSTRPERKPAVVPGHPADNIPERPGAVAAPQLSAVPEPEVLADEAGEVDQADEVDAVDAVDAEPEEERPHARKPSKTTARSPKPRAAQAQQLSPLEAKQAKKSVSDAAYAAASATRKATDRLNELAETIERCVADGLPSIVIEAELLAAASRADVELPLDDLRALLRP